MVIGGLMLFPRYDYKEVILNEDQLRDLCGKWQEALRLTNWDVFLSIARGFDMPQGTSAYVDMMHEKDQAVLRVLAPGDYPGDCPYPADMELSLVHELVHVRLAELTPENTDVSATRQMEKIVHAISVTLVAMQRHIEALEEKLKAQKKKR
jgi:hypothetical protein